MVVPLCPELVVQNPWQSDLQFGRAPGDVSLEQPAVPAPHSGRAPGDVSLEQPDVPALPAWTQRCPLEMWLLSSDPEHMRSLWRQQVEGVFRIGEFLGLTNSPQDDRLLQHVCTLSVRVILYMQDQGDGSPPFTHFEVTAASFCVAMQQANRTATDDTVSALMQSSDLCTGEYACLMLSEWMESTCSFVKHVQSFGPI